MGSNKKLTSRKSFRSNSPVKEMSISDHSGKHQTDLEKLNLFTQPIRTLKLFSMAMMQYLRKSITYLLSHRWCMLFSTTAVLALILLVTTDGPHVKHVEEVLKFLQFGLWWVALGVASSIGLGSGLHTFVLYLGPHIALFTLKAMKCGRVDLKMAPYDTIQFQRTPLWLCKDCSEFGPPIFSSSHGTGVPLSSILPQVQLEAVLWGLGTALGELPRILFQEQTLFIISVCNNQLLYMVETKLIRMLSFIPGLETMLPKIIAKLHSMKDKYMATKTPSTSNITMNKWDLSLASVWNGVVTIMLLNFFIKIVNATAQQYLKRQQEEELAALKNKSS
ncbi:unnamed protein product [Withania somnifera]